MDDTLLLPLIAGLAVALLAAAVWGWVQLQGRRAQQAKLAGLQAEFEALRQILQVEAERRAIAETTAQRVPQLEAALHASAAQRDDTLRALAQTTAQLQSERDGAAEKLALLDDARKSLTDAFSHLSSQALQKNNESFLALARTQLERYQEGAKTDLTAREKAVEALVKPLQESLRKVDGKLGELEQARVASYAALNEQLKGLVETHLPQLHRETASLVTALRTPTVRGRWGEIQLTRVVEMAGMVQYCDFTQQESRDDRDGALELLRPARVTLGELHDEAPTEVRDDLQVEIDYVQALIDALEEAPPGDPAAAAAQVQAVTAEHPGVADAASELQAFADRECAAAAG